MESKESETGEFIGNTDAGHLWRQKVNSRTLSRSATTSLVSPDTAVSGAQQLGAIRPSTSHQWFDGHWSDFSHGVKRSLWGGRPGQADLQRGSRGLLKVGLDGVHFLAPVELRARFDCARFVAQNFEESISPALELSAKAFVLCWLGLGDRVHLVVVAPAT